MNITSLDRWILEKHSLDTNDREAVSSYQLEKIQALIAYAVEHSPFYRRLYARNAIPRSLSEFSTFPTIEERDLVRHQNELLCVSPKEIQRIVTLHTSGTTDTPKRVFFTREDIDLTLDFFHHGMKTMCGAGDRALILFPAKTPDSVGALLKTALEQLGLHVVTSTVDRAISLFLLRDFDLVCGPASWVEKAALKTKGHCVRAVLTSSEKLEEAMRLNIERAWRADVFDHYGMTETGLGGAVECEAHQGMHIRENDLYFETVDAYGVTLTDGVEGELLVTTLTRRGMPFIRYRTGDRGAMTSERCPCGSHIPRISHVRRTSL